MGGNGPRAATRRRTGAAKGPSASQRFFAELPGLVFIERHGGPSRGRFSGTAQQQLIRLNHDIGEILVPPTPRRIRYQRECRRVLQALSATGLEPYELTDSGRSHKERCRLPREATAVTTV